MVGGWIGATFFKEEILIFISKICYKVLRSKLFSVYFILGCPKIMSYLKNQTLLIY